MSVEIFSALGKYLRLERVSTEEFIHQNENCIRTKKFIPKLKHHRINANICFKLNHSFRGTGFSTYWELASETENGIGNNKFSSIFIKPSNARPLKNFKRIYFLNVPRIFLPWRFCITALKKSGRKTFSFKIIKWTDSIGEPLYTEVVLFNWIWV